MPPQTRYARSGDLHIAYQTIGDGPRDLVLVDQWFSNVDAAWDFPPLANLMTRLAIRTGALKASRVKPHCSTATMPS